MDILTQNLETDSQNSRLFRLMSLALNLSPDFVSPEMLTSIAPPGSSPDQVAFAYANLIAAACGLDAAGEDRAFFRRWFAPSFHLLAADAYRADPYLRTVAPGMAQNGRAGKWLLTTETLKPCEAFVFDDPKVFPDGRILPQIGFFQTAFSFPAVLENGREWMTITPNEINTMRPHVAAARGEVLTFGLGLGYFAFLASEKEDVTSVTVVEQSADVIELFTRFVLPHFPHRDKIRVVRDDAFAYAERHLPGRFGYVFTDLWHDPSDGVPLCQRMMRIADRFPGPGYGYWILDTLRLYF